MLALYVGWLPPLMIALVLFRFTEQQNVPKEGLSRKSFYLMLLFALLLVWQICGLMQSDSLSAGIERIYKRASILLFPIALFWPSEKIRLNIKLLLRIYAVCLLVYFVYCLSAATCHSISLNNGEFVFNQYDEVYTYESYFTSLRLVNGAHPSYVAMYSLLALLISLDNVFDSSRKVKERLSWTFAGISFILFIVLLSSRAAIIATIVSLPLFILFRIKRNNSFLILLIVITITMAGFITLALNNSRIKYSLENASENKISKIIKEDVRFTIWKSAWIVIKSHPLLGVGTGNASSELKKEFVDLGYSEGLYDDLNAHNQFLEILLENGIIGLTIFLALLGYIIYIGMTEHNEFLLLFLLMIIIFFIFESMLNRVAGVMFFPLFTFILLHYKKTEI
jgi:O-antigen ligase